MHNTEVEMSGSKTVKETRRVLLGTKNTRLAKLLWRDELSTHTVSELKKLSFNTGLSIASGEILLVDGKWYVTHAGLLQIALRRRCIGIRTVLQERLSDPIAGRWVFEAVVYTSRRSKGFVGYGDADPSNVSPLVHGAEMRIAETRAVNRALRKAYGIGLCSVEELGSLSGAPTSSFRPGEPTGSHAAGSSNNGHHPRLRDQLCLLIRQFDLDPALVKAYAADFCGTETLKGASRELVESFVAHLSKTAKENRDALVCKLNSYAQPVEAKA
jgi:hypothetical protein